MLLEKQSSIEDRGQTDRVTCATRAGLHCFRWPQARHTACLTALARSWWRHSGTTIMASDARRCRHSCSTRIFHWPLTFTCDLCSQFPASYCRDPYSWKINVKGQLVQKKQTHVLTRPILLTSPLTRTVIESTSAGIVLHPICQYVWTYRHNDSHLTEYQVSYSQNTFTFWRSCTCCHQSTSWEQPVWFILTLFRFTLAQITGHLSRLIHRDSIA